jgi:protein-glutamine gamma-glutamyltransferase
MTPAHHPLAPEQRTISLRDLAGLLASLALVIVPHALRIPWWLTLLLVGLYAWRTYLALNRAPLPSRWLVLGIALLAIGAVYLEYRTLFGRTSGIVLLVMFSGLKLMEMRTHRDAAMVAFLCYFLVMTNLLYTQSIPTALLMALALVAVTGTLVGLSAPQRAPRANLRTAGTLLAHAAPAALVLFLLFPRVQGPLWGLPQDAYAGDDGSVGFDVAGQPVAARAVRRDRVPRGIRGRAAAAPGALLARAGAVGFRRPHLAHGRELDRGLRGAARRGALRLRRDAGAAQPHLDVRPGKRRAPAGALAHHQRRHGRLARPVRTRLRYDAASLARDRARCAGAREQRAARARPAGSGQSARPGLAALVAARRGERAPDPRPRRRLLPRRRPCLYPGSAAARARPVDEFLFETREGFCEHFASSFVFLMRAAGVPTRVVTGYQGGEVNYVDRIISVRQSDAHAWAEVYLPGEGWLRVDPTAAAVPGRVLSGLARSVREGDPVPLLMRPQMEWLQGLRSNWEALVHRWNVWVLGYGADRQRDLMARIGMRDADWRKLTAAMASILGAFTLLLVVWSLRRLTRPDPVQRAWQAFCRKLGARGVTRAPHEGPRDFAERAAARLPAAAAAIRAIAALYIGARYGRDHGREQLAELRHRVRDLRIA